jgi:Trk-type K+ transport system membrane component
VSIPTLYIGLQVLYVIMMYISVYPVVITMRHSNVYEERSLGIYTDDMDSLSSVSSTPRTSSPTLGHHDATEPPSNLFARTLRHTLTDWQGVGAVRSDDHDDSNVNFIRHQIRGQLSHDLWLLVLAVLIITTIETRHFIEDPVSWSVFNVVFEVVSAYGCVGISVGVPFNSFSFSGGWYTGSKLVCKQLSTEFVYLLPRLLFYSASFECLFGIKPLLIRDSVPGYAKRQAPRPSRCA